MTSINTPISHFASRSVIVFSTHPAEATRGCGGLIAGLRNFKIPVQIVLVTLGKLGNVSSETSANREQICRDAAEILGVADFDCWGEPNQRVAYNERTIDQAMAAIRGCKADLVFIPSFVETSEDNRSLAWVVIEASRRLLMEGKRLKIAVYEVYAHLDLVDALVDITPWQSLKENAYRRLELEMSETFITIPSLDTQTSERFRILNWRTFIQPAILAESVLPKPELLDFSTLRYHKYRVSILIRSLNRDTLSRALNSVALQTYSNIDIHILNVTGKQHRTVGDRVGRFSIQFHDPEVPVRRAAAANLLLDYAEGEFALFLDDDDWLAPDHISSLVTILEDHPEAVGAYADVEYGQLIHGEWQAERIFSAPFDRNRLLFENYLPIHAVLFRHILTRQDKGSSTFPCRFDEDLDLFEDWDFWLQLTSRASLIHIEKVSAYYLHHGGNQSAVFEEGDLQRRTRDYLLDKWRQRLDSKAFIGLLDYLQSTYREKSTLQERVIAMEANTLHQNEHYRSLQTLLSKRDKELSNTKRHLKSTQSILDTRLGELENARGYAASLQETLAARDEELLNAREHAVSLQEILAARDEELVNTRKHATSLQEALATRDVELLNVREHAVSLQETLAARDEELLNTREHAEALDVIIKARDEEIKNLHDRIADLINLVAARDNELANLHAQRSKR